MKYKELSLEVPLFYNNPIALRFEIGLPEIDVWQNYERRILNEAYFDTALTRALDLFETIFALDDEISIIYHLFLDRRNKIRKSNYLFKQIKDIEKREVTCTKYRSLDTENYDCISYRWNKAVISGLNTKDINVKNILLGLINIDFGERQPFVKGRCLFINHTKDIVLNLYDDRGMDVVALEKRALEQLYKSHSDFILEYDRERIDEMFL